MKKQIVFVDYAPNIMNLKIAQSLKNKGGYETVLISFSEIDRELYNKAFDKIMILDVKHKINFKNLITIFKKIKSPRGGEFVKEVKALNPYLFQITGPDLFTTWIMFITKNRPKIYFAYDIWAFYGKRFSLKNLGIKEFAQRTVEKICFKKADGILHKGPDYEIGLLDYKIDVPSLAVLPGCLDKLCLINKNKKQNKELHLVYAGGPLRSNDRRAHFTKIIEKITSQNIHFHTFGKCVDKRDKILFVEEAKRNKYYHFHNNKRVDELNKEISKYDYGISPDFYDPSIINPLHPKVSVANKVFNYIEAGIPIIISEDSEYMSDIVKGKGIGFVINYNDLENIKDKIKNQNYEKFVKNVLKTQKKFSWSGQFLKELENFYKKIASN